MREPLLRLRRPDLGLEQAGFTIVLAVIIGIGQRRAIPQTGPMRRSIRAR